MSKSKKKALIIEQLVKECNADGEKAFNSLIDKSEQYLTKLLQVARVI